MYIPEKLKNAKSPRKAMEYLFDNYNREQAISLLNRWRNYIPVLNRYSLTNRQLVTHGYEIIQDMREKQNEGIED